MTQNENQHSVGESNGLKNLTSLFEDGGLAEQLFDLVSDMVFFVKDEAARYVLVNESIVVRSGSASKAEVVGKTSREVYGSPLGDFYYGQDLEVLEQGVRIDGRIELHLYADGSRGWCLTHKIPIKNQRGTVVGLAGISRDLHEPGKNRADLAQAAKAIEEITTGYGEPLRIGELAERAGLSVSKLERIIGRVYGMTPTQLLAKSRLDAAARLLENTGDSITRIAHACGYTDHSAFTRQFRNSVGITPREYRNRVDQKD